MQDEHFIRQWNDGHRNFTADLHQALNGIGRYQRTRQQDIGGSYGFLDKYASQRASRQGLSPAAQASLRGLAASVITFLLWVTVMLVVTPVPGLAATPDALAATAGGCLAHPMLA